MIHSSSGGALAPRSRRVARAWPVWIGLAALFIVFVAYYWQVFFAGRLVSASDLLYARYFPYAIGIPPGFKPSNAALTDSVVSLAPAMTFVRDSLASGQLPLWNPYTEFGMPFFAQSQWGILSPVQLPFLVPPGVYSIYTAQTLVGMLKIAVAGTGAYFFARRLRLSLAACVFAGIAWMLGGYTTAWLSMPASAVTVFLPWICLAFELTLTGPRPYLAAAGLAALMACAVAGGHPEALVYSFLAVAVYGAVRLAQEARRLGGAWRHRVGSLALAIVLAVGIGAVILLPAIELLSHSVDSTQRVIEEKPTFMPWNSLIQVFAPGHFGGPQVRGPFYSAFAAPWYAGVVTAITALFAVGTRDRRVVPFVAMALLTLMIGMNTWPWRKVEDAISLLAAMPKSAPLVMWAFALSMTGAIGVDRIGQLVGRWSGPRQWLVPLAGAALCGVLFGELYAWGHSYNPRVPRTKVGVPAPAQLASVPSGPGAARTLYLGHTVPFLLSMGYGRPDIRSYGQPTRTDYDSFMRTTVTDLSGVLNPSEIGYPVANLKPTAMKLLAGFNARYVAFSDGTWDLKDLRKVAAGPLNVYENPGAAPRAFTVSNFTVEPRLQSALDEVAAPGFRPLRQAVLDRRPSRLAPSNAGPPPSRQPRITQYRNDHVSMKVTMRKPGLLVLSDSDYPGWRAKVDGRSAPIYRADGLFRAVALSAGAHEVQFDFDPASVKIGALASLLSLIATVGVAFWGRQRRFRVIDG